jgi:hypothetical protein
VKHLRAALVLAHVVAVLLLAIPYPPPGLRGGGKDASTEAAIATWSSAISRVGIPRDAVEALIRHEAAIQMVVVGAIRGVLHPYVDALGLRQEWLMFGEVPDRSARLEIAVDRGSGWEPLYVGGSATARWEAGRLEQERLRTLVSWFGRGQGKADYEKLVDWVAARVDGRVRVQLRVVKIPPPDELRRTGVLAEGRAFRVEERE